MEKCYNVCFLYSVPEFNIWGQQSKLHTSLCWKMLYVELLVNINDFVLFSCIYYIAYVY